MNKSEAIEEKKITQADIQKLFQDAGLKMTNQRIAVYREILRDSAKQFHPTAEQVYEGVRRHLPAISLNTVYRALTSLAEKGLVKRLSNFSSSDLYDGLLSDHWHFICTQCGSIQDIFVEEGNFPDIPEVAGDIEEVVVQFRGVCRECRGKGGPERDKAEHVEAI
ncbi:MAG: transcriptional repressor [Synergistaceae bacterium]|jgi:Fur family peroxide stress response transcriptional regulator|nr:transcriptional repressor [Synergistaceae bacterium]